VTLGDSGKEAVRQWNSGTVRRMDSDARRQGDSGEEAVRQRNQGTVRRLDSDAERQWGMW
jgi:hypothetical protein